MPGTVPAAELATSADGKWNPEPPKVNRLAPARRREYRVTTRETPELHAYRAQAAVWVRYLPLKLQGPMFAHVIMADIDGDARKFSWDKAAAWSAKIAPRYKPPAASARRYSPELRDLGLVFYELDDTETYIDHAGNARGHRLSGTARRAVAFVSRGRARWRPAWRGR